jgi:hypothetical protein
VCAGKIFNSIARRRASGNTSLLDCQPTRVTYIYAACTPVPLASDVTCTNIGDSVPQQCVRLAYLLAGDCIGMYADVMCWQGVCCCMFMRRAASRSSAHNPQSRIRLAACAGDPCDPAIGENENNCTMGLYPSGAGCAVCALVAGAPQVKCYNGTTSLAVSCTPGLYVDGGSCSGVGRARSCLEFEPALDCRLSQ